jgi:hypothetical protein
MDEERLIGAEWLKNRFYAIADFYNTDLIHIDRIIDEIDDAPEGVFVHGRWEPHYETFEADTDLGIEGGDFQTGWQCSVCRRYEPSKEPYCNCGARMDGDSQ